MTPQEEFANSVLLLRQQQQEEKQQQQKEGEPPKKKQKMNEPPPPHPWHSVLIQLQYLKSNYFGSSFHLLFLTKSNNNHFRDAWRELDALHHLSENLQNNQVFGLASIVKQTYKINTFLTELTSRATTKKQALSSAASTLREGSQRLRKIFAKEQSYFTQLLTLRERWLISKIIVPGQKLVGQIMLDFSCKSSKTKSRFTFVKKKKSQLNQPLTK